MPKRLDPNSKYVPPPRKPGRPKSVTGKKIGRPKGASNRASRDSINKIREMGKMLPLEYMLKVMNNPQCKPERRDNMARAAAPYCHNRLAAITLKGDPTQPVRLVAATMTMQEAAEAYALMRDNPRAVITSQAGEIIGDAVAEVIDEMDREIDGDE
jgi:hypothetical protein